MTSSKPYLFRATVEWIEDNGLTPHIVVDANMPGVVVPTEYVKDGEIVLNVSTSSIKLYVSDNEAFNFSASFSGKYMDIFLPMSSIKAVFARENQQGMFFNERITPESAETQDEKPDAIAGEGFDSDSSISSDTVDNPQTKKPTKKASHLKVIK